MDVYAIDPRIYDDLLQIGGGLDDMAIYRGSPMQRGAGFLNIIPLIQRASPALAKAFSDVFKAAKAVGPQLKASLLNVASNSARAAAAGAGQAVADAGVNLTNQYLRRQRLEESDDDEEEIVVRKKRRATKKAKRPRFPKRHGYVRMVDE